MVRSLFSYWLVFSSVLMLFWSCIVVEPKQDDAKLQTAIAKYKAEYLATEVDWIKWNGNINTCDEGDISEGVRKKALKRINYFRTLCNLYPITFKEEYNRLAQKAAAIILVNNKLSHYPDKTWKCYSEEAYKGTSESSISLDYPSAEFIKGFIKDPGMENTGVPHRRSLLFSMTGERGYGATGRSEAIYHTTLQKDEERSPVPKFIAYPVAGYNEIDLVYPRWSFGLPKKNKVDYNQG